MNQLSSRRKLKQKSESDKGKDFSSHAYSEEGEHERLVARLDVRIKPTTVARLRLFSQDPVYATPLIDEVVDEVLHDYLIKMGY